MKHIQNFKAIVLGAVIILVSLVSNATVSPKNTSELYYAGILEDKPAFRLTLNNNQESTFIVTVSNKRDGTLFTEKVKAKNKAFLFQLDVNDISGDPLQVMVKNVSTQQTETFTINLAEKIVLETRVSKL